MNIASKNYFLKNDLGQFCNFVVVFFCQGTFGFLEKSSKAEFFGK